MDMMRSNMGQQQQQLMQPHMDMMAERQMSPLRMSPMNMYSTDQGMGPNQYFLQDKFGNYAYAYTNQNSEKMEKGDQNSVQGHYAYIMSNGQKRRVEYIADNQGFHVIRDDADNASRFKRSVEPDLIRTKMTSYMDSSSLRDDSRDMHRMMSPNSMMQRNNQIGHNMNNDMSSQMVNHNMMSQDMYSNMMNSNMMGQDMMNQNIMGQDMSNNMMNHNMMGRNMMGQDMSNNMMNRNMMGRDMSNNMMYSNMMNQDMPNNMMNMNSRNMMSNNMMNSRNMMKNQMMGQGMMQTNMMNQGMNRMNSYANNELMGQNRNMMSQRMEIEQIPSTRLF